MADQGEPKRAARLRLVFDSALVLGPGRADLLQLISETGSIAAAGRAMRMSYKRAWLLVDALNTAFDRPLVEVSRGGAERGGAVLTALGLEVLARYRRIEELTRAAIEAEMDALALRLARPPPAACRE